MLTSLVLLSSSPPVEVSFDKFSLGTSLTFESTEFFKSLLNAFESLTRVFFLI